MLMFEERLKRLLRPALAFEKESMKVRGLLADPLERDQVFLGDSQRLG